ncbi:MAG: ATP-binding protein [Bacteroidetes bacterium]|nr:ATP-binding protein [Bacteroidota bacterium]
MLPIFTDLILLITTFLLVGFLFGRPISRWVSIRRSFTLRSLRLFYSRYSVFQAWDFFQKPQFYGEEAESQDFLDYFTQTVFQKKFFEYSYFFLLGPSGIGKSTALIRLYAKWKYALREEPLQIRLVSFSGPNVYQNIGTMPDKQETILLIDNLDSEINQANYREAIDQLIEATKDFARVVVACQSGFLPQKISGKPGDETIKFVGETQFKIFRRIELIPWNTQQSIRFSLYKLGLLNFRKRKKARKWIQSRPELFERPGYLTWIKDALYHHHPPVYPHHLIQSAIHGLIGKLKPEAGRKEDIFAFLVSLSQEIKSQDQSEWLMDSDLAKKLATEFSIDLSFLNYNLLELSKEGFIRVISPAFLAYFIAWKGFHAGWSMGETRWEAFPEIQKYFRNMGWEKFMALPEISKNGRCYLDQEVEQRKCESLDFIQIPQITRLYIPSATINDWRFLKGLTNLKGLYLESEDMNQIGANMLIQFPHPDVRIYFSGKVLKLNQQFTQKLSTKNEEEFSKPPIHYLNLVTPNQELDPDQTYTNEQPAFPRITTEDAKNLFQQDLFSLPSEEQSESDVPTYSTRKEIKREYLRYPEWDLFDLAEWHIQPDQSFNLILSHRHPPTLLVPQLREILGKLFHLYGEDDQNQGEFHSDDEIQIEEGYWFGRTWAWKVSNSYAHPIQIYMVTPGIVRLEIYGIKGNFVDSSSVKKLSTKTST